jgi:hypothetical protein
VLITFGATGGERPSWHSEIAMKTAPARGYRLRPSVHRMLGGPCIRSYTTKLPWRHWFQIPDEMSALPKNGQVVSTANDWVHPCQTINSERASALTADRAAKEA